MRNLKTIQNANANAQRAAFRASFQRARLSHPSGFTLNSLGAHYAERRGFAVAVNQYETIDELIADNANVIASGNGSARYFGFWRDDETGAEYIEAVEIVETCGAALRLAYELGEKAIYDFRRGVCVDVASGADIVISLVSDAARIASQTPRNVSRSPFAYFPILGARG